MLKKRRFRIHPDTIFQLIGAQAGSLGKAVLECVMNSVDAGATFVRITIHATGLEIADDGQGFRSQQEIENWFEVLGFPHKPGDRIHGQFGVGRAQLWSFCSTTWRTGPFEMKVDVKESGLDYDLRDDCEPVVGVTIAGTFYERQLPSDLQSFNKELADLARYCQIPVVLNGKQINRDPKEEKWDFDTPDAWVRLTDTGQLAVYNLGVLVRRYPAHLVGSGGVVITKPGVRLAVNMARNDVLVARCTVWKRIKPMLQKRSDDRVRTKPTRLTEGELENLAYRFIVSEVDYDTVASQPLITDIVGRGYTLTNFASSLRRCTNRVLTIAEAGSRLGERAHRTQGAFVLSPVTIERFGADSLKRWTRTLKDACAVAPSLYDLQQVLADVRIEPDLAKAVPALAEGYEILAEKDLKPKEKAALKALTVMVDLIVRALINQGILSTKTRHRQAFLGVSEVAEAWTDGGSQVVLNREMLPLFEQGVSGFVGIANLVVHEWLHDNASVGSHTHDYEFYERYHEATCGRAGMLNRAAILSFQKYAQELKRLDKALSRRAMRDLDQIEAEGTDREPASPD